MVSSARYLSKHQLIFIPPFCTVKNAETPLSTHMHFQMREQRNVVLKTIEEECKSLIKEG
jgi:hypothetical protein